MKTWTSMLMALVLTAVLCFGAAGLAEGILTLPSAVKEIQAEAFAGAEGFAEIVLPEGVETIGERAFAESSIEKINLPRSVESIADDAFKGCDELTIYGETGSYAQTYAAEHSIPFISEEEAALTVKARDVSSPRIIAATSSRAIMDTSFLRLLDIVKPPG